jgi:hypothetical protein
MVRQTVELWVFNAVGGRDFDRKGSPTRWGDDD